MKIAIVGAGISGLFTGLILKYDKNYNVKIFEKSNRIGGRIQLVEFAGQDVIAGAGIGRDQDKLLKKLCKNLGLNLKDKQYHAEFEHTSKPIDISVVLDKLKSNLHKLERSTETFKEFATKILGQKTYEKFLFATGETDYENADVIDTIYNYGFKNYTSAGFGGISIDWKKLLESFEEKLIDEIELESDVKEFKIQKNGKIKINNEIFDKMILAVPINEMRKLLPKKKILSAIKLQPFVRLYVQLDVPLNVKKSFIKTRDPFQKIIVINKEKLIYQISYSDNNVAREWKKVKNIKETVENGILDIFKQKVNVLQHRLIYWKSGTHYFEPLSDDFQDRDDFLKQAQHPYKNVFCVGEGLSNNQGWCEGALESVVEIIELI